MRTLRRIVLVAAPAVAPGALLLERMQLGGREGATARVGEGPGRDRAVGVNVPELRRSVAHAHHARPAARLLQRGMPAARHRGALCEACGGAIDAMSLAAPRNAPCPLRKHLLLRWREDRDEHALELLLQAVPSEMPAAVWIAMRDEAICDVARWLRGVLGHATRNELAEIVAAAGKRIVGARPLVGPSFRALAADEREDLAERIRKTLQFRPAHLADSWPGARQTNGILEAGNVS